jgi:DNA polymerase-3 subunit alpha
MGQTLQQAAVLEGSLRNTGVHACGVIITPEELTNLVPVANAKDSELRVTQFDNSVVESAGLLKMDFLGLKTLSIINSAIQIIHNRHGVTIEPDDIPLDDPKTFELYQAGNTNGTFQFESPGMQKHLKALKPDKFEDLIAMNALYRPGPLEYIPNFIARKHGHEPVVYDLPEMEEYLAETYGITVYQEQVMLLSQKLAGFTKGEADTLRKAMGKKQKAVLDKMKDKFIAGCTERGHRADVCEKVWRDWEAFAQYAFNKSHSTCYSVVAFHTAYLKANYPAEYMAAVLSNNMSDIKKVTFFMDECRSRGIPVLGPDINESELDFSVNAKGEIRFGLGGMKGVGEAAVQGIIQERALNGPFAGLYDFLRRINTQQVNKKTLECLAQGGAFDGFAGLHRAVFFAEEEGKTFVERCVKYAQDYRNNKDSPQASLFGESTEADVAEPPIPQVDPWPRLYLLNQEKAITGVFVSSHPLADFRAEMKHFCNTGVSDLEDLDRLLGKTLSFAGLVTSAQEMMTKAGDPWGKMIIEDQTGSFEWAMFREDYLKWRQFFTKDLIVHVKATVDKRVFKNKEGAETVRLNLVASQIKLMTKVAEEMIDGLELKLSLDAVSMQRIEALKAFMAQHSGKKRVVVNLTDPADQTQLRLIARSGGIQFNNESLRLLDQILAGIPHKLLTN